jgi:hypothetical protein
MNRHIAAAALLVTAMAMPQAWANSVSATFTFTSPAGSAPGDVYTYTNNGIGITASGFSGTSTTSANTPTGLYDNTTVGNTGLGLANDYYSSNKAYEIPINEFVQLDFSQVPNLKTATIQFQMTDIVDGWRIYGSNNSGMLGSNLLQSGSDSNLDTLVSSAASYKYVDVIAGTDCETLLNKLDVSTTTSTPEPTTSMLTGLALAGLGIAGKKLRRSA